MAHTVAENASIVLATLYAAKPDEELEGKSIAEATSLEPHQVNDAVTILVENGYAEWMRFLGTAPFSFGYVSITPRGRVEYERGVASRAPKVSAPSGPSLRQESSSTGAKAPLTVHPSIAAAVVPMGSPFGFLDQDWEIVADRRGAADRLNVVLGYQFVSTHYDSTQLVANVEAMFTAAVASYNALPNAVPATLSYRSLSAGYGEHLFNEIARDIISADIAVFDTSDLNANVMIEIGVALTWGVRVLVIKNASCPKPPSDISGQTWADYENNAAAFADGGHAEKLVRMVERAVRKKVKA